MRRVLLAIGVTGPLLAGCGARAFDAADARVAEGRLAGQTAWIVCARSDSSAVGSRCSGAAPSTRDFKRLAAAARAARQRLDVDSSAAALHEAALLALRLRDSIATGLDDAARLLERARRAAPADAAILNDFAVVQLEIGHREQTIRPFLVALDAIERSLVANPEFSPALFNRALILERLYLLATAQRAWMRYLTAERDGAWSAEAKAHEARLARPVTVATSTSGRDEAFRLLGDWGRAVATHDDTRAAALLDSARRRAPSDTLGDQSVRLALAEIVAQTPAARARLAAAHVDYSDGFTAYSRAALENAALRLAHAEQEFKAVGSSMAGWAALYRASAELARAQFDTADARLRRVIEEARPEQSALIGKAISNRGVIQARQGNYELANRYYRESLAPLGRAREQYNEGGGYYLLSESLSWAGQHAAGVADAYRGVRLLAPYRTSNFLSNHLKAIAGYARADSLPYAALAVMDEVLTVARTLGRIDALALSHRTRARDLDAVNRRDSARAELATAMRMADSLEGHRREQVRADIQLVQGQLMRTNDPRGALPLLDSVATAYGRLGDGAKASQAMYETAMAARDAGDTVRARDWLVKAIAQIERQQATFQSSEGRAALFETADAAFDAMIDLELRAGHRDDAFAYLERERAAAKSMSASPPAAPGLAGIGQRLPSDMVFVEFGVLGDRTIAWTASRRGTSHHVIAASRDSVARLVDVFLREASIPDARAGDARSQLYDLLIGPLANDLAGARQISIVPDRELSRLPFAALWDQAARRYVVENYRVRTEPSASFLLAALAMSPSTERRRTALVVGNPALDSLALRLEPLPGAEREARRVATLYKGATPLIGGAARRDTVVSLLQTATVFHFAGHAVFNGDRPELSYLALGPPRGSNGPGALSAREIGELRLSNLELVVLSACRTVSARTSRTGGVAGLASSFLRAGAPAIISTLWDVSDEMTEPLLAAFHKRFAAGATAADALREAQLEALRPGQAHSAPASWAAFIYTGP